MLLRKMSFSVIFHFGWAWIQWRWSRMASSNIRLDQKPIASLQTKIQTNINILPHNLQKSNALSNTEEVYIPEFGVVPRQLSSLVAWVVSLEDQVGALQDSSRWLFHSVFPVLLPVVSTNFAAIRGANHSRKMDSCFYFSYVLDPFDFVHTAKDYHFEEKKQYPHQTDGLDWLLSNFLRH